MKKLHLLILAAGLLLLTSSCYHQGRHVTIARSENGQGKMRIEYTGRVVFNDEKTGISYMSPHGYFEYSDNGDKLTANCDAKGKIVYAVNDTDNLSALNPQGLALMADAIKEIEKTQGKKR